MSHFHHKKTLQSFFKTDIDGSLAITVSYMRISAQVNQGLCCNFVVVSDRDE